MKKIIHLTDTHVGFEGLSAKFEEIITSIINRIDPSEHIIIHTGDIVEDATIAINYVKASTQIRRLRDAGFTVLLVPGNHDYGTGANGDRKFVAKFKETFLNSDVTYPIKTIIDDIVFIGLDSMAEELHVYDQFFADGELGNLQLAQLRHMLNSDEVRNKRYKVVYLHHHPFESRLGHSLNDSIDLRDALAGHNIDALLFGHNHGGEILNEWGIPRVYDGGTSTGKEGHPNPHRVIDLSKKPATDYDGHF